MHLGNVQRTHLELLKVFLHVDNHHYHMTKTTNQSGPLKIENASLPKLFLAKVIRETGKKWEFYKLEFPIMKICLFEINLYVSSMPNFSAIALAMASPSPVDLALSVP